jgi:hypothetical protein
MKITSIECISLSIHFVKPIVMSSGAAASAHFMAATEWTGRIEQEATGDLNLYSVPDTVSKPITDDSDAKVPRYENIYPYAPDGARTDDP